MQNSDEVRLDGAVIDIPDGLSAEDAIGLVSAPGDVPVPVLA